ncbi:flagellar basal body P-ring formation chaperone FlgA [Jannaschia sp. LMIT008]|uniref:flagellar basal body P-ring formation chaperone FlgA n=1 Tax=Jannaschia maritima TaxID=3032585 RepID=UPI002811C143|nr:flagellar basal body P-ring formation chaperone FlgA [Jannaschia sp. LMIT008]
MIRAILISLSLAGPAAADVVIATTVVRAGTLIGMDQVAVRPGDMPGAVTDPRDVVGLEARVNLFPNRPVRPQDVGAPTVIERNAVVSLLYAADGLRISAEGRALTRAGLGEPVRVMNMASRTTVMGVAVGLGTVEVH